MSQSDPHPSADQVERIRSFRGSPRDLVEYIRTLWTYRDAVSVTDATNNYGESVKRVGLATLGESANERIHGELDKTMFAFAYWQQSSRGGGHVYEVKADQWERSWEDVPLGRPDSGQVTGDWILTYTGKAFYPLAPRAQDIDPRDIARGLSMQVRYNGHVSAFYSVAEHCVLMSHAVPPEDALAALLHDGTEAYVGDLVRPIKKSMPEFIVAEDGVWLAVCERFNLDPVLPASVKDADNRILLTERKALLADSPKPWGGGLEDLEPLPVTIYAWSPAEAEQQYLARLEELLAAREAAAAA